MKVRTAAGREGSWKRTASVLCMYDGLATSFGEEGQGEAQGAAAMHPARLNPLHFDSIRSTNLPRQVHLYKPAMTS